MSVVRIAQEMNLSCRKIVAKGSKLKLEIENKNFLGGERNGGGV